MLLQQQNAREDLTKCLIALGSNLSNEIGASVKIVEAAIDDLSSIGLFVVETSRFFRTPAFPAGTGPDFVNAVVYCETALSAEVVLEQLHKVEERIGRTREKRWEARVIDLDLIDYDGQIMPDIATFSQWRDLPLKLQLKRAPEQIILPHPRIQDRLFVLIPLRDVASNWRHPVLECTVDEMIAAFNAEDLAEIVPYSEGGAVGQG
ncbi:2-amino-4-hydroxy-6-hydroxymethyldihydropteridine diphosphokinase [Neptunicoccus cionae]|uniref:2-amino-4-hydroxy-6-hydroxymethyldihydropteridine pyrophosphokinase n=1 Tax=Neptunicoccus cionae TaxID=2035344 RepID=A0A916R3G5_9RHOB|nr:2-amino-4-hydroxy-6-hydroxymethyldihydropteridine diphosphokinase [Amylibacter cionae]GGA31028.1 2-amino-4-hydroxy-6-hydroxymethyldihydropteridine pyrophosphokinase [Amylibacter cionae]